jgi:hypothetical protein
MKESCITPPGNQLGRARPSKFSFENEAHPFSQGKRVGNKNNMRRAWIGR